MFAAIYVLCVPAALLVVMTLVTSELRHWLLLSVLMAPLLLALGLAGLMKGLLPIGLLVGAIAARTPFRCWPKLLAAGVLPLFDLLVLRTSPLPRLVERGGLLLMDHRALFILDTMVPLAASMLATVMIPQRLVRRILGGRVLAVGLA